MPVISILSVMRFSKAWNTLPDKTFTICFHKCGISEEAAANAIADEKNYFAGWEEDDEYAIKTLEIGLQFLKTTFELQVDEDLTTDDYINFDWELCTN